MEPTRIYQYLERARERLFDAVRPLTPEQYARPFPLGLKAIGSTLAHLMNSEWYYMERFQSRTVPPYSQWPIQEESPPAFAMIEARWRDQMARIRAIIAGERDWSRRLAFDSFANEQGKRFHVSMTTGDLISQLALHEVHHRSQVMAMLRMIGEGVKPLEDIDYGYMMFERVPIE